MNPEQETHRAAGSASADSAERSALDWVRRGDRLDHFLQTFEMRALQRRRRRWRAAIGGAAALIMVGFAWQVTSGLAVRPSAIVAQPVRQTLPDGSVVELREGADFVADYTDAARRVVLRRGVAYFEVAKNPKPFVVLAGEIEVRAVGTAFSVQFDRKELEVLVTEGRVAVRSSPERSPRDREPTTQDRERRIADVGNTATELVPASLRSSPSDWIIDAGERMVIGAPGIAMPLQVHPVTTDELAARLAWRVPRLEFNGAPLADAVATINRYSRVKLRVLGDQAGKVELSGVLRADNIDPLLTVLEGHYGLTVVRSGEVVTLSLPGSSGR